MAAWLISTLGLGALRGDLKTFGRYIGGQALILLALLTLAVIAAGFGLTAVTLWLTAQVGAAAAFAIVAAGLCVLAVGLQVVLTVRRRRRASRPGVRMADRLQSNEAAIGSIAALALVGYLLGRRLER
jgi:hypothetical protein